MVNQGSVSTVQAELENCRAASLLLGQGVGYRLIGPIATEPCATKIFRCVFGYTETKKAPKRLICMTIWREGVVHITPDKPHEC